MVCLVMHVLFKPYANSCFIVSYLYGLLVAFIIMRKLLFVVDSHLQDEVFHVLANNLYSTMRKLFSWVCIFVKPSIYIVGKNCLYLTRNLFLVHFFVIHHVCTLNICLIIELLTFFTIGYACICMELKPWRRLSLMACVVTSLGPFFCIANI